MPAQMPEKGKHTRGALYGPWAYRDRVNHRVWDGVDCQNDHWQNVAKWGEDGEEETSDRWGMTGQKHLVGKRTERLERGQVSYTDRRVRVVEAQSSWKGTRTLGGAYFLLVRGGRCGEGRQTMVNERHAGVGARLTAHVGGPQRHRAA
jgi:hypothetical protein